MKAMTSVFCVNGRNELLLLAILNLESWDFNNPIILFTEKCHFHWPVFGKCCVVKTKSPVLIVRSSTASLFEQPIMGFLWILRLLKWLSGNKSHFFSVISTSGYRLLSYVQFFSIFALFLIWSRPLSNIASVWRCLHAIPFHFPAV